ncbi:MAG: hypothetical protein A2046_14060 [Bacteroidetes bacterium GWA2_30_7]|nr:MAG: hypothetical protein A2046_14060 [Bacteroidetes bacterium GWA2_30_7]
MNIEISGAKLSSIVKIGDKIKELSKSTGKQYLSLNRGVNSVCNIDLTEVVKNINFNSNELQVYPPSQGRPALQNAINQEYFQNKTNSENIYITAGGMSGLDLTFQTLQFAQILLPAFYWGSYLHILNIRKKQYQFYENYNYILQNIDSLKNSVVLICEPNNPVGNKYSDDTIFNVIETLNKNNIPVIMDCPYRRVFYNETDDFYSKMLSYKNVIIVESFSKSIGLSGQRLGFVHTLNNDFNHEFGVRLMYATNGINAFSQMLVEQLLTSEEGKKAVKEFKATTTEHIKKNINYLRQKKLLAEDLYVDSEPVGIFAIVNKSEEELLQNRIGSISLSYFVKDKEKYSGYSRICVSVHNEEFCSFI